MRRFRLLRRLVGFSFALMGLTFLAGLALVFILNPDHYRNDLSRYLSSELGREVHLNGKLSWHLLPSFELAAYDIVIDNPQGFDKTPFLTIAEAQLHFKLLPLLRQQFEVEELSIKNVDAYLIRRKDGDNWSSLFSKLDTVKEHAPKPDAVHQSAKVPFQLQIKAMNFAKIEMHYQDEVNHRQFDLNDFSLRFSHLAKDKDVPLSAAFRVQQQDGKNSWIMMNTVNTVLSIQDDKVQLKALNWKAELKNPALTRKTMLLTVKGKAPLIIQDNQFHFPDVLVRVGGLQATLRGSVTHASDFTIKGTLEAENYNPEELMSTVADFLPVTLDLESARNTKIFINFEGNEQAWNISKFNVTLAKTLLSGNIHYAKQATTQKLDYALQANHLNVDELIKGFSYPATKVTPVEQSTNQSGKSTVDSLSWFPVTLQSTGAIFVNSLGVAGLHVTQFQLKTALKNGILLIQQLQGQIEGGQVHASGTMTTLAPNMATHFKISAQNIPLKTLLSTMHKRPYVTGALYLDADLNTVGKGSVSLKQNLQGLGTFHVEGGEINGMDLNYVMDFASSVLSKKLTTTPNNKITPIRTMQGTFKVQDGAIHNSDLKIEMDRLNVKGEGFINLIQESLDYHLLAERYKMTEDNEKQKQGNVPLAIHISGAWEAPTVSPDLAAYGQTVIQQKIKDTLQDNANQLLQKNLKKLFQQ